MSQASWWLDVRLDSPVILASLHPAKPIFLEQRETQSPQTAQGLLYKQRKHFWKPIEQNLSSVWFTERKDRWPSCT